MSDSTKEDDRTECDVTETSQSGDITSEATEGKLETQKWSETRYKKGQKVLCYEPNPNMQKVIYHANILEIEYQDVSKKLDKEVLEHLNELTQRTEPVHPTFLVHFQNWGPKYDRWVAEDLILDESEENLELQRRLDEEANAKIRKRRRKTSTKQAGATESAPKDTPSSSSPSCKYKLKIVLPPTIKQALERDFVNITLRNLLIQLPRSPTVQTILAKFAEYVTNKTPVSEDPSLTKEFVEGISTYFDFMLPLQLLYKDERSQYECEGIVHTGGRTKRQQLLLERDGHNIIYPGYTSWGCPEKPGPLQPSKLYGIEHLLRLFVKLPEYLDHMDAEHLRTLSYFSDLFLSYVAVHRAEVFVEVQPYREALPADSRI